MRKTVAQNSFLTVTVTSYPLIPEYNFFLAAILLVGLSCQLWAHARMHTLQIRTIIGSLITIFPRAELTIYDVGIMVQSKSTTAASYRLGRNI